MAVATALAPDRRSFIAKKKFSGQITVRKDVRDLKPQEVFDFRQAIAGMAATSKKVFSDKFGFQWIASVHGNNQYLCQHGTPGFALWHRPYVSSFEQAMQDVVPGCFLPYWDWTSQREIPSIFTDKTWVPDPTQPKLTAPNPLLSQPMFGGHPTTRHPGPPAGLVPLAALVQTALTQTTYDTFRPDLENPHNKLHLWVGGDMRSTDTAAFDPIFWVHHCFVEKVFCDWQDAHPGVPPPTDVPPDQLYPWQPLDYIWNYHNYGYVYQPYSPSPLMLTGPVTKVATATNSWDAANLPRPTLESGQTVAHFTLGHIDSEFHRAEVRFEGLTPPEDSFEVRVFINEPNGGAGTKTDGNPNYLGSQHFFGHGLCSGSEGHCDPQPRDIFDARPRHHLNQINVRLNVTKPLRELLKVGRKLDNAPVTLVVVDDKGKEMDDSGLHFEGFSLIVS